MDTDVPKPKESYGIASVGILGQRFLQLLQFLTRMGNACISSNNNSNNSKGVKMDASEPYSKHFVGLLSCNASQEITEPRQGTASPFHRWSS